ncbi:MAG: sigma-70 family RNA polymerase sigma factor [Archangium sp.]
MAKTLSGLLLARAGRNAKRLESWAPLEQTLHALVERGRAAWPKIDLDAARFVAHLGERLGADPVASLGAIHAEDLFLACACVHGISSALQAFEKTHLSQVEHFVDRRARGNVDELQQVLRMRLLVAQDGAAPGLAGYSGRGALGGFVRVAAVRVSQDSLRGKAANASDDDDAPASAASPGAIDPELAYLKKRHAADFKKAFEKTLAGLSEEDRTLLSLHLLDSLTTQQIGALYRVDGSTIRRRLTKMREAILEEIRRAISERLKLRSREFESLLGMVRSELDLSLRRYLKGPSGRS